MWATDCPLAAIQFEQHAGVKALHPLTILARAYRSPAAAGVGGIAAAGEGFANKVSRT